MSLIRSSAWAAASALLIGSSRLILGAIFARRLSLENFGQFAYGQWLVDLSFLVCSLGAAGAISRYAAEYRYDPSLLASVFRRWRPFALGLPFFAASSAVLGAWLSGLTLSSLGFAYLATWTLFNGLWAMQSAALVGLQRFDLVFWSNLVFAVIVLIGSWFLPSADCQPLHVFALLAGASFCALLIGAPAVRQVSRSTTSSAKLPPWRSIAHYSGNIWFSAMVASLVWSRGELPIVRSNLGDQAVAHYAVALTIFSGAVQGVMLGVSGVAPHLTRLWGGGKKSEAITLSRFIMDVQLLVCGLGSLFITFFGPQLISIVFTKDFADAAVPLSILCVGMISFVVSSQSQLLQLETNAEFNRNVAVLGVLILYTMAYLLIPKLGILGAALTRSVAMLTLGLVTALASAQRWGWRSVSSRNIAIVLIFLSGSILIEAGLDPAAAGLRVIAVLIGWFLLLISIRDSTGLAVIQNLYHQVIAKVGSTASSARGPL